MVVLTKENMIAAEKAAIRSYITEETLMENAGTAAANFIINEASVKDKKVTVVVGKGNNGKDGLVMARVLLDAGAKVTVIRFIEENFSAEELMKSDIIVDAIFGIGFRGKAEAKEKELIDLINSSNAYTYSVDLPSGLECNGGAVLGSAVKADCTLTFEALKPCHILPPTNAYCGKVEVFKIGIKEEIIKNTPAFCRVIEKPRFPKRDKNSHKGTFGSALSVAGCYGMPGASILAARAALRSGVGKLYAVCPPENYLALAVSVPEAVLVLADIEEDTKPIFENLKVADSVLVGPGLSVSEKRKDFIKELLLSAKVPVIVDADGINCLSSDIDFIKKVKTDVIFTPHSAEMARLTGLSVLEVEQNRGEVAKKFSKEFGVYLCLKGANTLVATPTGELYVNLTGTPALATAGSGDVLSGIIVSLLAQGFDTLSALTAAVYIHGAAGEKAAKTLGENGVLASDVIENLPYLL